MYDELSVAYILTTDVVTKQSSIPKTAKTTIYSSHASGAPSQSG